MLGMNDIVTKPREWAFTHYPLTEDDIGAGVPIRLFRVHVASDFGAHFRLWTGATAGAGTQIAIASIDSRPATMDFGPGGISIPHISFDWGADPLSGSATPKVQGRGYYGYATSFPYTGFGVPYEYDFTAAATILFGFEA